MHQLQTKTGDILKSGENIIIHQVNGIGVMGAGIAGQIKKKHPAVFTAYKHVIDEYDAPEEMLGVNAMCYTDGTRVSKNDKPGQSSRIISNVFGQVGVGTHAVQTHADALLEGITNAVAFAAKHDLSVAVPYKIGCGLGGGNWQTIQEHIRQVSETYHHPVTVYKLR